MDNPNRPQTTLRITFGLISHPSQVGWPKHGCFVIDCQDERITTKDMFSIAACRETMKAAIERGDMDGDQATELERAIVASGLPTELTRFDRLVRSYGDSKEYTRLVDRFCNQSPPEIGSDVARFKRCVDGKCCGLENCTAYPAHAMLYPDGIVAGYEDIVFSRQGAENSLVRAVEAGVLLPEEADRNRKFLSVLSVSSSAEQADRFVHTVPRSHWHDHLDVIFGFRRPEKPARFGSCMEKGICCHLYAYDDREVGMKAHSRFDARYLTDKAHEHGLITTDDAKRLQAQIPGLDLPDGSKEDSIYTNAAVVVSLNLDQLLQRIMGLTISQDDKSAD